MRIPLDYICIKSGILCPRCQRLVDSGVVSNLDVELMKALLDIEENQSNFRFLKESSYVRSVQQGRMIVVILDIPDTVPQQTLIRLSRLLSERLGGFKVRIVRNSNDLKSMVSQIVAPARIMGINTVWLPDGSVQHVIRMPRYDARLLPAPMKDIETLLTQLFKYNFRIKLV
ncbi:MAG: transcription elongation factor NusA [Thermoprotei archaeon]|nr:MAG: transcription elongation factor NusA [Thermoprotei archaeon]